MLEGGRIPRRPMVVLGVLSLLVTLVLGLNLAGNPDPTRQDLWGWNLAGSGRLWRLLDLPLRGHARRVVADVSDISSPSVASGLGIGLAFVHWRRGERDVAAFCLASPALVLVLTEWVAKPGFHRTLEGGLAYPSGHAAATFTAGTMLALLAYRGSGLRAAAITAVLWSVPVASLALYDLRRRDHYPTDLVGGAGLGVGLTCLVAVALLGSRRPGPQHRRHPQRRDPPVPDVEGAAPKA